MSIPDQSRLATQDQVPVRKFSRTTTVPSLVRSLYGVSPPGIDPTEPIAMMHIALSTCTLPGTRVPGIKQRTFVQIRRALLLRAVVQLLHAADRACAVLPRRA